MSADFYRGVYVAPQDCRVRGIRIEGDFYINTTSSPVTLAESDFMIKKGRADALVIPAGQCLVYTNTGSTFGWARVFIGTRQELEESLRQHIR